MKVLFPQSPNIRRWSKNNSDYSQRDCIKMPHSLVLLWLVSFSFSHTWRTMSMAFFLIITKHAHYHWSCNHSTFVLCCHLTDDSYKHNVHIMHKLGNDSTLRLSSTFKKKTTKSCHLDLKVNHFCLFMYHDSRIWIA